MICVSRHPVWEIESAQHIVQDTEYHQLKLGAEQDRDSPHKKTNSSIQQYLIYIINCTR